MKTKSTVLIITGLLFCLYACKKDNGPTSIVGKWSIIKTVYYQAHDTTVNGIATDYYNFGADGSLVIHDHPDSLSGIYSLKGINSVGITIYIVDGHGLGVATPQPIWTISNLTASSVTLTSPPYPSGQEIVYLQK